MATSVSTTVLTTTTASLFDHAASQPMYAAVTTPGMLRMRAGHGAAVGSVRGDPDGFRLTGACLRLRAWLGYSAVHIAREGIAAGWDVRGRRFACSAASIENIPAEASWLRAKCQDTDRYEWLLKGAEVVYHCAAAPYEGLSVFSPQVVFDHTLSPRLRCSPRASTPG